MTYEKKNPQIIENDRIAQRLRNQINECERMLRRIPYGTGFYFKALKDRDEMKQVLRDIGRSRN